MIKLIKSSFYHEEEIKKELSKFILETSFLSMGEQCEQFEKDFSKKQDRKHAIFVGSGSSANLVLIQSLMNLDLLKKRDCVGVSALTWATNIMPIIQLGLVPLLIDCELETLNVSSKKLEPVIGSLKAVFLTNVLGFSDDITKIAELCNKNNMLLFEDNCESLGSKTKGKLLGNYGIASTFSFFVGHHLSTIEGGMICTDDDSVADMLRMVRAHGWDRNLSLENKARLRNQYRISDFNAKYTFYDLAYNARPTEINGFLGVKQLKYLDEIIDKRFENFKIFSEAVKNNTSITNIEVDFMDIVSNFAMPLIFKDREAFFYYKKLFEENNVEIRPIIGGDMSKQPFFKKYVKGNIKLPNTSFISENGFYFGNNPEMTPENLEFIVKLLRK